MHRFAFHLPAEVDPAALLHGAHLVGAEGVPVRAEIRLDRGMIHGESRGTDAVGLSLLWPVKGFGTVQLETTRLPPANEPYHLNVELARHRLMRISFKREEWGLFDYPGMDEQGWDRMQEKSRQRFRTMARAALKAARTQGGSADG